MSYLIIILSIITTIYFCSILWVIIGFLRIKAEGNKAIENTVENKISVIIPVRNEEHTILNCLNSLKDQNFKAENFEVLVINDHSTDNTENVVSQFIATAQFDISYYALIDENSKKEALKLGVEKSKYETIATTDADCILPENWLKIISTKNSDNVDMLLGPIVFNKGKGLLSGFQNLDMFALQGVGFGTLAYQKPILNNAANLAYSKKAFKEVKGFDNFNTPSGDDVFLLEKFESQEKHIKGFLSKELIVETKSEKSLNGFFNQRLRWASKSKHYTNKLLIFFSSIIFLENSSILFTYLGIIFSENYKAYFIILLVTKWLIDFILLLLVADFFERKRTLFYFIPVQLLYPIYIVIIWVCSMLVKFKWKERKFNE